MQTLKFKQQGAALIIFAVILVLAATTFLLSQLDAGSIKILRNNKTVATLAEAKAAVIGDVVSGGSGSGLGVFPCSEDTTKIDLSTEGEAKNCINTDVNIGRFAWKTLGTGILQDGNADKFWYALSPGFRAAPINSDSVGALSVNGLPNQAIAIVFSPGVSLTSQLRPSPTVTSPPVPADYLDTENGDNDSDFITGTNSATYNDNLLMIKHKDIYPMLEKRVLGEFKNYLNAYKFVWGRFPFPAAFGNPTTANYVGSTALTGGFLPISNANTTTAWNTSITPIPIITNLGTSIVNAPSCSFRTSNSRIRCEIDISSYDSANPPTVAISGIADNIGLGFYDGFTDIFSTLSNDVRVTTRAGTSTVTSTSRVMSYSLDAAARGTVTFNGVLVNNGSVRIEFRRTPIRSNWVLATTNNYLLTYNTATKIGNNWHYLVYYKAATPYLPGGAGVCGTCLTVNQISLTQTTMQTNVHALLMSAGWRLDSTDFRPAPTYNAGNPAQARPGAILSAYFDSINNTSGGILFDNKYLTSIFNDQIRMVEYD
jgi:hypothetical protein